MNTPIAAHLADLAVSTDLRFFAGDRTAEHVALNLRVLDGAAPSMTAKPRVVAKSEHTFEVTFGHGGRMGRSSTTTEHALREASQLSFIDEVFAAWGTAANVHALALACNSDRTLFVKTIKRIAKERFGVQLSARGGRGTGSGWVSVGPATKGDLGAWTIAEVMCDRGSIRPCGGERVAVICHLAGHPLPAGFVVRAPQWD